MKKIFVGYTSYQDVVYQVARYSIERNSLGVKCYPIIQKSLRELGVYYREKNPHETTEFSVSRFLTPWLAGYRGWVMFIDNDVLALADLNDIFNQADDRYAVMCAKHVYNPPDGYKLDNKRQVGYPRKNWSSVILWNLDHKKNRILTPELVNEISPLYLHRFMWLEDNEIGEFSYEWNWLVGWYREPDDGRPKILHYTEGGPYFAKYQDCEYAQLWRDEYHRYSGKPFQASDILDNL